MRRAMLFALLGAWPSTAAAFEVKTTSSGEPLRWPTGAIVLQLSLERGPSEVAEADAEAAIVAAAASWQAVLDGSRLSLAAGPGGENPAAVPGDGVASVRWALDLDDPGIDVGLLAVTQIGYRMADGAIQDADVVVNAGEFGFTTSAEGCTVDYDLESTLAHEFGHLLGLGHPPDHPEATMYATGSECETLKRDLAEDDVAGIDHLYRDLPEPTSNSTVAPAVCSVAGESGGLSAIFVLVAAVVLVRRRLWPALAITTVAWLAGPALSAQLRALELAELGVRADLVVRGVVLASRPAPGGELATDSELRVSECFAGGDCPATLQVRRRGGEQEGRGLWVDGEAELTTGAEVILYLHRRPDGLYRVIGGVQGVLQVVRRGGAVFAVRDLRGHRVLAGGAWRQGEAELVEMVAVRSSVLP